MRRAGGLKTRMKNKIQDMDRNFAVPAGIDLPDAVYVSALEAPVKVYGLFREGGKFRRIPEALAKETNEGVLFLHANTAGGRARFTTNSPYLAIHAEMPSVGKMPHFALTGSAGFDVYVNGEYRRTFTPPFDIETGYDAAVWFPDASPREITVHFPLYSEVSALYFGVRRGSSLSPAAPYEDAPPVVYYGSSITQGGCASRPGLAYQNIVTRALNRDHLNLGFSGSAKGEQCMARYIAGLRMSAFVLDYDHNAPTAEHLAETHEPFFKTVRAARPALPILLLSRPKAEPDADETRRIEIIRRTYENARAAGDENVRMLTGPDLMALCGNEGTVDDCHPNDLGFFSMAKAVEKALREMLK